MAVLAWLAFPSLQIGSLLQESWHAYRGASRYPEVPPLDASLRVVGEAVLDRTFTLAMNLATGIPHPSTLRSTQAEAMAMSDFIAANGWFENPLGYHQTPPDVDEHVISHESVFTGPRPTRYAHLRFPSEYAPYPDEPGRQRWLAHENNNTAHAYVLEHEGAPRPWLVCVHGFGMGRPTMDFFAFGARFLHETLGLNLIFPCLPLHGPRGAGRLSGRELLDPDYLNLVHIMSHAVWDLRRAIRWLRSRGAERIGLYGLSLGAYNAALVAALEPDLSCALVGIPAVDFPGVARDNEPWVIRRYDPELQVDWELIRAITYVVSPLAFAPRVPHQGRFIFAGTADRVSRPNQARALWRHWDRPDIHWFSGSHVGFQWNRSISRFVESSLRSVDMVGSGA